MRFSFSSILCTYPQKDAASQILFFWSTDSLHKNFFIKSFAKDFFSHYSDAVGTPGISKFPAFVHHALNRNLTHFLLVATLQKILFLSYESMAIMKREAHLFASLLYRDYLVDNNRYDAIKAHFGANHVSSFEREGRVNTGQHSFMP